MSGAKRYIALHEGRHLLAGACAAAALKISDRAYGEIKAHVSITEQVGECGFILPDTIQRQTREDITTLMAYGPVARADDIFGLVKSGSTAAIKEAGDLSQADVDLAERWGTEKHHLAAPLLPLRIILATKYLTDQKLRISGFTKMCKLLTQASDVGLEPMDLHRLVPKPIADVALAAAAAQIDATLSPAPPPSEKQSEVIHLPRGWRDMAR